MPIPKPKEDEEKNDFVSRCMSNETMIDEFEDPKQRTSVCLTSWRETKTSKANNASTTNNKGYIIRKEELEGRKYSVVPVVMMVEGVHEGNAGKIFYSAEELSKYAQAWNGRDVPVYHPEEGGEAISANSPEVIKKYSIGRVFNAKFDEDKKALVAELWIDEIKANKINKNVLTIINSGGNLEVSTGMFFDSIEEKGKWNDEDYIAIASNIRPDHLAVLPGEEGACSWKDGCGVRFNKKKDIFSISKKKEAILNNKGISHDELRMKLKEKAFPMEQGKAIPTNPTPCLYIKDVYDDYFIAEVESQKGIELFKYNYSILEDGNVVVGDKQKVELKISYEPVILQKGGKEKMDRTKEIAFILSVPQIGYVEADRELLVNMEQTHFEKLHTYAKKFSTCKECNGVVEPPKKAETLEELIGNASPEIQEVIKDGVRMMKEKKNSLISVIKSNKRNRFTDEQLNAKIIDELENIVALSAVEVDFSLRSGSAQPIINVHERTSDGLGVPEMPVLSWSK